VTIGIIVIIVLAIIMAIVETDVKYNLPYRQERLLKQIAEQANPQQATPTVKVAPKHVKTKRTPRFNKGVYRKSIAVFAQNDPVGYERWWSSLSPSQKESVLNILR